MAFIREENLKNLAESEYKTSGSSWLDKKLNPFWEKTVLYMPKSLAPNLITTIGLICVLLSYIIMLPYGTHFSESIPSYILFISALLIFAYQTLDAIDGKQARRVKASSPLGMLFDHGCDSMSTSLLVLTITQGMGLGLTASSIFLYIGAQTTFFIITWEEYHTSTCRTQFLNWGVTEVQWILIFFLVLSGLFGNSMCKYMVFKDVTLADFTIFGNMGFAFLVNFWVIFNTVTKSHSKNGKFESLVPLILSDITMIFWANHEIMQSYAPVMMLVHSLVFSGICSKLIISSVTKMKFDYFHLDVLIEFLFAFESIYIKILPPVSMLLILSLFIVYRYFSFTYKVTHQIATYMNISVYKVD